MFDKIILGILTAVFGLGAYLSARKMARGPVFYYGKTFTKRSPPLSVSELKRDAERINMLYEIEFLMAYLSSEEKNTTSRTDLLDVVHALQGKSSNFSRLLELLRAQQAEIRADSILARVEASAAARTRTIEEPATKHEENPESQRWKNDVEKRLRALEERSAARERSALAMEEHPPAGVHRVN